ncbi:hypothetical protein EJV47_23845 [Hymenobacter gummosus]|uniref:Uncharacterized protein n=1 Tax=Hymenobacter gummosus TaxID=1776032 RepID=A0A3S0H609_9BACT|nr:hypothetical protein [Hymenobacter gummosus]RTQ45866.1 hypothetical protein EJV47_23845 [Hymenobacter gummosus]
MLPSGRLTLFLTPLLSAGLAGCSALYGLRRTPETVDFALVRQYAQDYGVGLSPATSLALDTSYYTFLRRQPTPQAPTLQLHAQPLQVLYFDRTGRLVSYFVNCNAGGFPNLNWNHDNAQANFPPASQTPPDSLVSFARLASFFRTMGGSRLQGLETTADYTVVVFWSHRMGRQSRRLLATVRQNLQLVPAGQRALLLYVNNDAYLKRIGM